VPGSLDSQTAASVHRAPHLRAGRGCCPLYSLPVRGASDTSFRPLRPTKRPPGRTRSLGFANRTRRRRNSVSCEAASPVRSGILPPTQKPGAAAVIRHLSRCESCVFH
jgi:hypothetical protein